MSKYKNYINDLATTFEYLNDKIVAQRNHTNFQSQRRWRRLYGEMKESKNYGNNI